MNRKDKEMLATQWAKRRLLMVGANGDRFTPYEAAHLAAVQYGLSMAAEMRVEKACKRTNEWPTQGGALTARLAA